ncbi:sensor histidine kinase [Paenimyroides marinum]|nr:histidine kinase [Paenimyroides aquimaris]
MKKERPDNAPPFISIIYIDTLIYLIPVAFAIAIQSGKRLLKIEVLKQEADNIKLQSELQHLKYQLQPHFFFNSLNNIYALVDTEPEKAKQTIHSLSKLMRHLLQNSEEEKVPLSDEINFLNKYISLMALRQNDDTVIETYFPKDIPNLSIAPLLFVSIVENAFKHGISATKISWLNFEMKVENNTVIFISKNYNFPKDKNDMSGSGIGIENLRKRLALLYENNHSLNIEIQNDQFVVTLIVKVNS